VVASAQVFFTRQYRSRSRSIHRPRWIALCVAELNRDKEANTYDSLKEEWSNKAELFNEKPVGTVFLT